MNCALHNTVWLDYSYATSVISRKQWTMSLARHNASWLSIPGICSIAWAVAVFTAYIQVPLCLSCGFEVAVEIVASWWNLDSNWHWIYSTAPARHVLFGSSIDKDTNTFLQPLFCGYEGPDTKQSSKTSVAGNINTPHRGPEVISLRGPASPSLAWNLGPGHHCYCTSAAHTEARVCSSGEIF